jgi:hypothetical protein
MIVTARPRESGGDGPRSRVSGPEFRGRGGRRLTYQQPRPGRARAQQPDGTSWRIAVIIDAAPGIALRRGRRYPLAAAEATRPVTARWTRRADLLQDEDR